MLIQESWFDNFRYPSEPVRGCAAASNSAPTGRWTDPVKSFPPWWAMPLQAAAPARWLKFVSPARYGLDVDG